MSRPASARRLVLLALWLPEGTRTTLAVAFHNCDREWRIANTTAPSSPAQDDELDNVVPYMAHTEADAIG